jgi:hypothetical protein
VVAAVAVRNIAAAAGSEHIVDPVAVVDHWWAKHDCLVTVCVWRVVQRSGIAASEAAADCALRSEGQWAEDGDHRATRCAESAVPSGVAVHSAVAEEVAGRALPLRIEGLAVDRVIRHNGEHSVVMVVGIVAAVAVVGTYYLNREN